MKLDHKRGFTLIEVLVAAAILVFAASASALVLRTVTGEIMRSSELTRSVYITLDKMEGLKTIDFSDLSALHGEFFAQGKGKIEIKPILPDLKELKVEYKWDPVRKPIVIYTLRSSID